MLRRFVSLFALAALALALAAISFSSRAGHASAGERGGGNAAPSSADARDLYHWPQLPVRIFIAANGAQQQAWARTALGGFDEWVRATHGRVGYQQVDSPAQAQITVHFVSASTVPEHPDLVGLTTTYWIGSVLQSAEIVLATGQKSRSELQTAAAHELGHALGIRGHSDNPDDLMFSAPVQGHPSAAHPVTNRDLNTLRYCYPSLFAS